MFTENERKEIEEGLNDIKEGRIDSIEEIAKELKIPLTKKNNN